MTNIINGKSYIGQSINIDKRLYEHFYKATHESDISYNSILHAAIRKYKPENFTTEVICECEAEDLDEKEIFYIRYFNTLAPNGYNILPGGQRNRKVDVETGKVIYKQEPDNFCAICGQVITKKATYCEQCSHQVQRKVDRPEPLELARMIKENGFTKTREQFGVRDNTVKKWCKIYGMPYLKTEVISWYNEHMGIQEEPTKEIIKQPHTKKVKQIDPISGEVINIFESENDAAKFLGKKKGNHIGEACKGILTVVYGYKWAFYDDNNITAQ